MTGSLIVEIETGTWTGSLHPHNGYYAGDFSDAPAPTQTDLDAMTTVCRDLTQAHPHS
ncbi:hypothetical protein ACWCOV_18495 [Kribbella sp. NPDC002412]